MADPRHEKLADIIINYSLGIKKGDKLVISTTTEAAPLVYAMARAALRAGAFMTTRISLPELNEMALREGSDEQLTHVSEIAMFEIDHIDAFLSIRAPRNTRALSGIDPARIAMSNRAYGALFGRVTERTAKGEMRWCVTEYPTNAAAQDAGMSLYAYEEFVYGACLLHEADPVAAWKGLQAEQQRVVDYLMTKDTIRIVAPGTDLTYRVAGRTWINSGGNFNFPDGEVFTGPLEDSVNGTVSFTYPAVHMSNEVDGARLVFKDGKVIESSAKSGEAYLNAMLDMDAGSRFVGEVAFGMNYGVTRFSKNTLFDEKIGGTMHMALGKSYPETGGVNVSSLHWDMVCDLRQGEVYADGTLCYKDGKFIF
jgi:aminopeptidase